MKKFIILVAIIIGGLIYWNWVRPASEVVTSEPVVVILASQNQSGEQGQAILTEVDGQVKVALTLAGASTDVVQSAYIHRGTCAAIGEALYSLSPVIDGVSENTITASFEALQANLPLAINVYKSVEKVGTYVVCGNLAL